MQCGAIRKNCLKHLLLPILLFIIPHLMPTTLPFTTQSLFCLLSRLLLQVAFPLPKHEQHPSPICTAAERAALTKTTQGSWHALQDEQRIRHLLQLALGRGEMPDSPAVRSHFISHFIIVCHIKKTSEVRKWGKGAAPISNEIHLPLRWIVAC